VVIVLCSRGDDAALNFARRNAFDGVEAVTCADVSREGWTIDLHRRGGDNATAITVAAERALASGRDPIEGVITRLGYVSEVEVGQVVPEDRPYVAAEMQAFLFAFLNALPCPKINKPSLGCLYAPHLRTSDWKRLAGGLGLAVDDAVSAGETATTGSYVDVTVLGERVWGDAPVPLVKTTRQLASVADVAYLRVRYSVTSHDTRFWGADAYPSLESDEIGRALVRFCRGGATT
jgi:hypothetical protein